METGKARMKGYLCSTDRDKKALSGRILVAYSGTSHVSSRINRNWIRGFLSGKTRPGWIRVNEIVHALAAAIKE